MKPNKFAISVWHVSFILLAFLFIALPILQFARLYDSVALPRHILLVVSSITIFLILLKPWTLAAFRIRWHHAHTFSLLFLLVVIASTGWSTDPHNTTLAIFYVAPMVLLFFILSQVEQPKYTNSLLFIIFFASGFAALLGIQQYFHFNPFGLLQVSVPASTFLNKNIAAQYFDLIIPISFLGIIYAASNYSKYLAATCFGLSLAFIFVSKTRGSLLALMIGVLIFLLVLVFQKQVRGVFLHNARCSILPLCYGLGLAILIPLLPTSSTHIDKWKVDELYSSKAGKSVESRLVTYRNTIVMIADNPWTGVGYNAFGRGFRPYASRPYSNPAVTISTSFRHTHNDVLQYIAELGLIGGLLPVFFITSILVVGFRALKSLPGEKQKLMIFGLLLAIVTSAAHAMVSFPLRMPSSAAIFWTFCGMILALAFQTYPSNRTYQLNAAFKYVLAVLILIFAGAALKVIPNFVKGQYHLKAGAVFLNMDSCEKARVALDRAFTLIPWDLSTINRYAVTYTVCPISNHDKFEAMNSIIKVNSTNPLAHLTRANLFLQAGDYDSAATDYYKVVELVPNRASGYLGLALIALRHDKMDKAQEFVEIAESVEPENPAIRDVRPLIRSQNNE